MSTRRRICRRGFTVVELLAAISIIGLILSLLAPAIQNARESARRIQCRSNLKQLMLAVHNYDSVYRCFPPAMIASGQPTWDIEGMRFHATLLPFLDQAQLYATIDVLDRRAVLKSYFHRHGRIFPEGRMVLPVLLCPTSVLPKQAIEFAGASDPIRNDVQGYAVTDYAPVGGSGGAFGMFPVISTTHVPSRTSGSITDGLSNTLAIGEHSFPGVQGNKLPIWMAAYDFALSGDVIDTLWPVNCVESYSSLFWQTAHVSNCAISFHPGISHFAFGDGAVRAISENIDRGLYRDLGNIADGNATAMEF